MVPYHCLGSIWSQRDKKGKEHLAPTIRATVAQFNNVANCVITTCLGDRNTKAPDRARVVEHWIEVARVCGQRGLAPSSAFPLPCSPMRPEVRTPAQTSGGSCPGPHCPHPLSGAHCLPVPVPWVELKPCSLSPRVPHPPCSVPPGIVSLGAGQGGDSVSPSLTQRSLHRSAGS